MKTRILGIWMLAAIFFGTSCSGGIAGTEEVTNEPGEAEIAASIDDELKNAELAANCVISGTVTGDEAAGILFMYEEEKMARDVYAAFYALYKIPVFNNISRSENVHKRAVGNLVTAFGLKYEGSDTPGEFVNPQIARLYGELIAMGEKSLIDALKAGALVEETDILDLKHELKTVTNPSVKRVFTNILAGSETHLRAFVFHLKFRKVEYTPVLIEDMAYYNAILNRTTGTRK